MEEGHLDSINGGDCRRAARQTATLLRSNLGCTRLNPCSNKADAGRNLGRDLDGSVWPVRGAQDHADERT